jgi:hypothetical protein
MGTTVAVGAERFFMTRLPLLPLAIESSQQRKQHDAAAWNVRSADRETRDETKHEQGGHRHYPPDDNGELSIVTFLRGSGT